jgi:branched-chain amino acid aminotransferase
MINHLVTAGGNPAYGASSAGRPTVCVQTFPLQFSRWATKYATGQHLVVPDTQQIPLQCLDPRIKSRNRLHWYLADRQARLVDESASALLLDGDGHITETSSGNFFIVRDGVLLTPRRTNTLNGVSQQAVIEFATALQIGFDERDITVGEAMSAEEAFTSSTSYCLLPVTRLNSQPVGGGRPGATYRRLLDAWSAAVGVDIVAQATT